MRLTALVKLTPLGYMHNLVEEIIDRLIMEVNDWVRVITTHNCRNLKVIDFLYQKFSVEIVWFWLAEQIGARGKEGRGENFDPKPLQNRASTRPATPDSPRARTWDTLVTTKWFLFEYWKKEMVNSVIWILHLTTST